MKSILCMSFVLLIATTASAQFSKGVPKADDTKAAEKTERKVADRGRTDRTTKAADQANSDADMANALLAIMDTDGDGVVTKLEMGKAMTALRKVHKDSKGNIAFEKPADTGNALAGDATQAGVGANNGAGAGGRGNETTGRLMQYDRNRDGVLTPDELPPQAVNMLRDADLDKNGGIDARELAAFGARMGEQMRALGVGAGQNGVRGTGVPGDGGGRKPPREDNK